MTQQSHRIRAFASRKITHPIFQTIDKHWLTVRALDFPANISTAANAREPVGLNRRVYRDVKESLQGKGGVRPGSFDLMNKGITILAKEVKLLDKSEQLYEIIVDSEKGGIVDGAHTAAIIQACNTDKTTNEDQFVEVYIRTGVENGLITDIASGLNTGMQVAPKSIYNIDGVFDWLKEEIADTKYANKIAWRESDAAPYDVRDLISVMELFNVYDFPNDGGKHPIQAYEKWSIPLEKFAKDAETSGLSLSKSKYYKLRFLLKDGLSLLDHVRRDFRNVHNNSGGRAGKLNIVEEATGTKLFDFPFAGLPGGKYRLTKGASYPIAAAFRNMVEPDSKGIARWKGGFEEVLSLWSLAAPELVEETFNATKEIGRTPDLIGKNRKHWDNLHMKVQLRLLRAQLHTRKK